MRTKTTWMFGLLLFSTVFSGLAIANDVEVVGVRFELSGGAWNVRTTLRHADSGWEHYADAWRVVNEKGDVLGSRTLHHPHESEQPFTRGLSGVVVPNEVSIVFVEAHDKVHGWSKQRVRVDLNKAKGKGFEVYR